MSSIFYRLDELERVQQEILAKIEGTEISERAENARNATHSHEMSPTVTDGVKARCANVPNPASTRHKTDPPRHNLIDRVGNVHAQAWDEHMARWDDLEGAMLKAARAAIKEVAYWLEDANEIWSDEVVQKNAAAWLRSQVEP